MALPPQNIAKFVSGYDTQIQGYTIAHREYDIGNMSLADLSLEPRDTLPNNLQYPTDSTFVIFNSRIKETKDGVTNIAVVSAGKAKFKDASTISGTGTQAGTTMTLNTGGPFYPQMAGKTMTIAGGTPATDVVAAYVSPTVVTMTNTQAIGPVAITFPNASTELAISRDYRGSKQAYWWSEKNFLEAKTSTDDLVFHLWSSYFKFNSHLPTAYAQRIRVLDEDPYVPTHSRITVEYRTGYNPKKYPIGMATQEMMTTGDTKKLLEDLAATPLDIDTKPDADGFYHAVETGSNIVPDPHSVFIIRTAIASPNYLTYAGYVGKMNNAALSKIGGGIPKWQALCLKIAVGEDYIDDGTDAYVPMQFWFAYYDYTLDEYCTARQRRRWLQAEFVLHPDNNPDVAPAVGRFYLNKDGSKSTVNDSSEAQTRIMMHDCWAKNIAAAEVTARDVFDEADFSTINALVTWGP